MVTSLSHWYRIVMDNGMIWWLIPHIYFAVVGNWYNRLILSLLTCLSHLILSPTYPLPNLNNSASPSMKCLCSAAAPSTTKCKFLRPESDRDEKQRETRQRRKTVGTGKRKEIRSQRSSMPAEKQTFPSVTHCSLSGREEHSVAADLDGTLLVGRSSFPYFMRVAVGAGSLPRGLLLLLVSPLVLFLYKLVSESAAIRLLIFVSVAGVPMDRIERVCRAELPTAYAGDVREESWRVFRACGRRRAVVTANPTVMVEAFVKGWLGGDVVLGTELEVDGKGRRATGFVKGGGVLVGRRKREAVLEEFGEDGMPEVGLGDRVSDHDFMALCKEGYMVHPDPSATRVPLDKLSSSPTVQHLPQK